MSRQHLRVGVHVDTRSVRLLQQHLKVAQVVAGNEDSRIAAHAKVHLRDLGVAVCGRVRLVEKRHPRDAELARFERKRDEIVHGKRIIERRRKCALDERIDRFVVLHQRVRVLRVRRQALQPVGDQFPQRPHVLVLRCQNAHPPPLRLSVKIHAQFFSSRLRLFDCAANRVGIEVGVGDGEEKIHGDEVVDGLLNGLPFLAHLRGGGAQQFRLVDELVLKRGDLGGLSADAAHRAAPVACRLLALPAKHLLFHGFLLFFWFRICGHYRKTRLGRLLESQHFVVGRFSAPP